MIRIEPYSDKEVKSVLTNLMNNQEFMKFIKSNLNKSTSKFLSIPGSSLLVMQLFKSKVKNINSVKKINLTKSTCKGKISLGGFHGITLTDCYLVEETKSKNIKNYLESLF